MIQYNTEYMCRIISTLGRWIQILNLNSSSFLIRRKHVNHIVRRISRESPTRSYSGIC